MLNCIEWEIIYWKYIQSKSCKIRRQIFGRRRYTNIKAKYGEEVEYRNIKAKYREAAQIISESPAALQLRYLQVSLSTLFSETFSMSLSFSSLSLLPSVSSLWDKTKMYTETETDARPIFFDSDNEIQFFLVKLKLLYQGVTHLNAMRPEH